MITSRLEARNSRELASTVPVTRAAATLLVLFGAALAFDNFPPLYGIAGLYTASPALLLIFLYLLFLPRTGDRVERLLEWSIGAILVFGIMSALVWLILSGRTGDLVEPVIGGDSLVIKGIKTWLIVATWAFAVIIGYRLRRWDPRALTLVGLGLLTVSVITLFSQVGGFASSGASDWAHALSWHEERPRGLKFESSVFGASLLAAVGLILFGVRRRSGVLVLATVAMVCALLSSSRGAVLAAFAGIALAIIFSLRSVGGTRPGRTIFATSLTAFILGASLFGFFIATSTAWAAWASTGSDATRSGWGLVALASIWQPPLGLNLFNYWVEVQPIISDAYARLSLDFRSLDLREFLNLAVSQSDSGLSPKSLPALLAVWFGLPGLIGAVILLVSAVLGSARSVSLLPSRPVLGPIIATAMSVISLATFVPGIFTYELALVLGAGLAGFSVDRQAAMGVG